MLISQIVQRAFEVDSHAFNELVEDSIRLLSKENGKIGSLDTLGRLVKIKPKGEALIIGDLHGDLESLIDILRESSFLQKLNRTRDAVMIFLGDYGDRGAHSAEVYYTVLSLKLLFPSQVVLMRGNHEGPKDIMAQPHDLPVQFQAKFGDDGAKSYRKLFKLFACMYNAALIDGRYLIIHGGLPQHASTIEDLAFAHDSHPKCEFLEEMLWSDPSEDVIGTSASPRGAGRLFGENVTNEVLKRLNARVLIRGHEPCEEGFKINHHGKVLTLFSRKGSPYFNSHGAYLDLSLSEKLESAEQLLQCVHRF